MTTRSQSSKANSIKPRVWSEHLEPRFLLTSATDAAIEQFQLSPALFVENDGQWTDASVRFVHQGKGASIAMTDRGPVFELYREVSGTDSGNSGGILSGGTGVPPVIDPKDQMEEHGRDAHATERAEIESTRFAVSFRDSNITHPIGHDRATSTFNYNLGNVSQHRSTVSGFEKVVYPSLYEGIDLHTWGQRDSLKYEFHVDPNIDYRQIAVQYEGVEDLWIDDRGRLHAELGDGFGEVIDDAPVIWQEVKGKRVDVAGRFKLLDGDAYTFELTGKFEARLPLVIDPDLAWSSYLGGAGDDESYGLTCDSSGNIYVTGSTYSSSWVSGGYDTNYGENELTDAFVVKLSAAGVHLWSCYLGGSNNERAYGVANDSAGNVYVIGNTSSTGWISGGFDATYGGGPAFNGDGFVVKLSAAGAHLWSTYLGGDKSDGGSDIALDNSDNVYVTGITYSSNWVSGGYDTSHGSGVDSSDGDGYVVKMTEDGNHLWSTYFGGTESDFGTGVTTDGVNNVYVTGGSYSSGWISGGFDTSYSQHSDAIVVKLNSSGGHLWSTYLGDVGFDDGHDITTDNANNVYVTGQTGAIGWVSGGFDSDYNGGVHDGFVAKFSSSGAHLWSTYLGGTGNDVGWGIVVDMMGDAYVIGETNSSGWVSGGFDSSYNYTSGIDGDIFVLKLSAAGQHKWSTYMGAQGIEYGYDIAIDSVNNIYVSGTTESSGWISGGHDSSFNGGRDAYVAQIISLNSVSTPPFNITGSSGDDTVIVTRTGDTITANVNGVITSRQLSNISMINITTGDGKDTITVDDDVIGVTIDSGNGDDRIIGSDNSDFIRAGYRLSFGDTENDYVVANEGNDTVYGDDGNDTITGSAGKDKLYGENGEDRINGGKGNDTIFGGSGDDRMYGNEDNDSIDGGGNVDRAWGGVGNDTIIGGGSNDKLYGEDGNDRFFGNAGADLISGGSGTDAAKDEDDENLYSSIEVYF